MTWGGVGSSSGAKGTLLNQKTKVVVGKVGVLLWNLLATMSPRPNNDSDEEEAEFDDNNDADEHDEEESDDDEDMPLSSLRSSPKRVTSVSYAEDESDDDDDIPLSSLAVGPAKKQPAPAAKRKENGSKSTNGSKKAKPATTPVQKKAVKKIAASPSRVSNSSSAASASTSFDCASSALYGSGCSKGQLIQQLLCRWWYAYAWPDVSKLPKQPPPNYDSLDGFVGVYVCTSGDDVGKILDLRNHADAPSFQNYAAKPASELRSLLVAAVTEQTKQLVQHDGPGTETQKELSKLLTWAQKINPDKADKEAEKLLKQHKL
jgi:hypothetical protein